MSLARGAAHGAAWSFATVVAERGAGFFVLALLMRVVPLRDVGLIAIASAISELARVVANSGAGEQVQANPGNLEIEAGAFWSQLIASLAFMAVLWFAAPWVASAYQLPLLPVLRVMAVNVVITAFLIVPSARLASQFRFRTIGFISFGSTVFGGACALLLAYKGYGLTALIIQKLVGVVFYAIAACICARWMPPRPPALAVMGAGFRFFPAANGSRVRRFYCRYRLHNACGIANAGKCARPISYCPTSYRSIARNGFFTGAEGVYAGISGDTG